MAGARNRDADWDYHLRLLSTSWRDTNDPAADPAIIDSVKKLCQLCRAEKSEGLAARAYPHLNKIFNVLLLPFLKRGHLMAFCFCEFADPQAAEATLEFLNSNLTKFVTTSPAILPQFFPLILQLIAWGGERLLKPFLKVFPGLISNGYFLPLLSYLMDIPIFVVALEKVERSSGSLVGTNVASVQKSAAPEMLLALMDEAYTGSTIGDGQEDSESDDNNTTDTVDPVFLELLKDENDGLAEGHWASGMAATLQSIVNAPQSEKLNQALNMTPQILDVYFSKALRDVIDSLICALIPLLVLRYATIFPDKNYSYEKPIMDRLGEAYDNPEKAIGEHGGGDVAHKDAASELFDTTMLIPSSTDSRLGLSRRHLRGQIVRRLKKVFTVQTSVLCVTTL